MTFEQKTSRDILSIDVDSHLQKLATHTYRSLAHYPVELVRSSLKRGSNVIKILIRKNRIEIRDNGSGINSDFLKMLCSLVDKNESPALREKAIENLQTDESIGLLAIFSPSPARIIIENVSDSQRAKILIQKGKVEKHSKCDLNIGTRITLYRKSIEWNEEEIILRDYCKFLEEDIILNGNPIERSPILTNSIVSLKLSDKKHKVEAWVGIPGAGDICCIWLMDKRIPWDKTTISPWNGFVFEAAVEHSGELTTDILNHISRGALKLYAWLSRRYSTYPALYKKRVEELLFKHYQLTGDSQLIDRFSPFKLIDPPQRISVSDIRKMMIRETIYAIPLEEDPSNYNIHNKTVLHLSNSQTDFLVNHLVLPITFLSAVSQHSAFKDYIKSFFRKIKRWMNMFHIGKREKIPEDELSSEESLFIKSLTLYHFGKIEPVMINSRGLFPSIAVEDQNSKERSLILIRRKHPVVKKAILALQIDPQNIELISPVFTI